MTATEASVERRWPGWRLEAVMSEYSLPLVAGVLLSIAWANLDEAGYRAVLSWSPLGPASELTLLFFANDLVMAFFFGLAAKEITAACSPGGALNPLRSAVNPLLATLGGVLMPIAVYKASIALFGADSARTGWAVPTATDIALAWLVARAAFGARHPAVAFLLLLAVADDGIGLAIIAIFYPDPLHPVAPAWLGLVLGAMACAWLLRRRKVASFWPYLVGPGVISWIGLYIGHLHPALALVPIVPFMPSQARGDGAFGDAPAEPAGDALGAFSSVVKGPVELGLFVFGLANAGVAFSSIGPATWSVLAALMLGKTLGITSFALLAQAAGFPLPAGMDKKSLLVAGITGGMGLTVALFVAGVAFTDPTVAGAAKMGALLSFLSAPVALAVARALGIERRPDPREGSDTSSVHVS